VTKHQQVNTDQRCSTAPPIDRLQYRDVRRLALEQLASHGLHLWSFAFNWRKRSMGLCVYQDRRIELSVHFVKRHNNAEILDTILHEIAHALVGHGHGHDAVWKRKCAEIGAKPVRCGQADMPEGRWQAVCKTCAQQFHRHRRPKRTTGWFCQVCGTERGKLVWRQQSDDFIPTDATSGG